MESPETRAHYEKCGCRLVREIVSLPADHPLANFLAVSTLFRAIRDNDLSYPDWSGRPIKPYDVTLDYLLRFDLVATFASGKLNVGPTAPRISESVKELRDASDRLKESISLSGRVSNEIEAIQWLTDQLLVIQEELMRVGLSVETARNLIVKKLVADGTRRVEQRWEQIFREKTREQPESGVRREDLNIEIDWDDLVGTDVESEIFQLLAGRDALKILIQRLVEGESH